MKPLFAALLLIAASSAGWAADDTSHEETVFLFENRKVSIQVPQLYTYRAVRDERGVVEVRIGDPKDKLSLQMTFLPDPEERQTKARARREQMFVAFREYVGDSTEQAMQFEELEPKVGSGTFCVFTDKALVGKTELPPNEYLHVTGGVKAWPGVLVLFRVFSNDTDSPEYRAAMKVLRESVEERTVPLR